jgi:hypothetical protein
MNLTQKNNRDHMLEIMLQAHHHRKMPATITGSETVCQFSVFSGSSGSFHHTLTHTVRILFISHPFLRSPANISEAQICSTMKAASDNAVLAAHPAQYR